MAHHSPMQDAIVSVLPALPGNSNSTQFPCGMVLSEILEALDLPKSNAHRASVCRALLTLQKKGKVVAWEPTSTASSTEGRRVRRYTRYAET